MLIPLIKGREIKGESSFKGEFLQFYLFADDTNIYYESSDLFKYTKDSKQGASQSSEMVRSK